MLRETCVFITAVPGGGGGEGEDLFVFNDTIAGPRAPAVKPGCTTQACFLLCTLPLKKLTW